MGNQSFMPHEKQNMDLINKIIGKITGGDTSSTASGESSIAKQIQSRATEKFQQALEEIDVEDVDWDAFGDDSISDHPNLEGFNPPETLTR